MQGVAVLCLCVLCRRLRSIPAAPRAARPGGTVHQGVRRFPLVALWARVYTHRACAPSSPIYAPGPCLSGRFPRRSDEDATQAALGPQRSPHGGEGGGRLWNTHPVCRHLVCRPRPLLSGGTTKARATPWGALSGVPVHLFICSVCVHIFMRFRWDFAAPCHGKPPGCSSGGSLAPRVAGEHGPFEDDTPDGLV